MNIIKLLGLFREELLIKYPQGKLKLSEIQNKVSDLLGTRLKFVEVKDAGTSLDMDAYEDQRIIEKINGFSNDKSQT
jgi:mRNA-degrading endonuclease HigB of HigAB toxin-antitoxin module